MKELVPLGERLYAWLVDASLQVGALVIALLLVERFGRRWLTPRWRYALWMVLMLRLALPAVPELPNGGLGQRLDHASLARFLPRFENAPHVTPAIAAATERAAPVTLVRSKGTEPAVRSFVPAREWSSDQSSERGTIAVSPRAVVAWAVVAVALALFGLGLARARRFERRLARARPVADPAVRELFESCRRRMNVARDVELLESEDVVSPALAGIRRPRVLLPARRSAALSGRALELVLCHELAHLRGRDIEVGLVLFALRSCFWFHPLVWIASARLSTAREAWRDWQALAAQPAASPHDYARTLLALAEPRSLEAAPTTLLPVHWNRTHELKRRIRMIHAFHAPTRRTTFCGLALVSALAWATMTAAEEPSARTSSQAEGTIRVERATDLPDWRVSLDRALEARFDLAVEAQPLRSVVAVLRRLTGVNLVVQADFLADHGDAPLDLRLVEVTLEEVLDVICRELGDGRHGKGMQALVLGYDVGPPERELCIYQVQSLIDGAEEGIDPTEELIEIVRTATVTPDESPWDEGGAWMECWNGLLFVNHSSRVQARVEAFLEFLASGGSRPATPDEPWRGPLVAALSRPAEIVVESALLKDVLEELSAAHGVSIQCDPDRTEEEITLELHGVDLGTVLSWIGQQISLRPRLASGAIRLDTQSGELELRLYDLTPIFRGTPGAERDEVRTFLDQLLIAQVEPGSWDADPLLEILFWRDRMLVRQSPSAQRSIAAVLGALERSLAVSGSRPPSEERTGDAPTGSPPVGAIRVAMFWDAATQSTVLQLGGRRIVEEGELQLVLEGIQANRARQNEPEAPVTIDAAPEVPWADVVEVLDLCKQLQIADVDFALPSTDQSR